MSKRIKEQIESALQLGAYCDTFSDEAFARGDHFSGKYWGNKAIGYYTQAEKLSSQFEEGV